MLVKALLRLLLAVVGKPAELHLEEAPVVCYDVDLDVNQLTFFVRLSNNFVPKPVNFEESSCISNY